MTECCHHVKRYLLSFKEGTTQAPPIGYGAGFDLGRRVLVETAAGGSSIPLNDCPSREVASNPRFVIGRRARRMVIQTLEVLNIRQLFRKLLSEFL
jgi:hypothetical protein